MTFMKKINQDIIKLLRKVELLRKEKIEGTLEAPPRAEFGDLATNICFQLAKKLKKSPQKIAEEIIKKIEIRKDSLISKVEAKDGYINFFFNWKRIQKELLKEILQNQENYGKPKISKEFVMVEHTSVNPNKALHIGHARNACLGDCLTRLLKFCGHDVVIANYIDDTGNQIADIVVGFKFLNFPEEKEGIKFDHYCGDEVYVKVNKIYKEKPELLKKRKFVIKMIEEGNNEIATYAKALAEKVLRSQLQTLWRLGIHYDLLNWESDIIHSKLWEKAFKLLKEKKYVYYATEGKNKGCWLFKLSHLPEFRGLETPDKILVRSDGTVVYAGKDIAYAMWKHGLLEHDFNYKKFIKQPNGTVLWETTSEKGEAKHPKFNDVDTSINVIDVRQSHEQSIVATAVKIVGKKKKEYIHYAYEVVSLSRNTAKKLGIEFDETKQFVHMSGRKGYFVNVDTLLDALFKKAYEETKRRNPDATEEFLKQVAEAIAIGTLRYEMVKMTPEKLMVFDMDEALRLEGNTAPYLQYAHTRCCGILRKTGKWNEQFEIDKITREEKKLVKKLLEFSEIVEKAARELRPNYICNYAYELATVLSEFYHVCPVIKAESKKIRDFRLTLIKATQIILKISLNLLGIKALEKM